MTISWENFLQGTASWGSWADWGEAASGRAAGSWDRASQEGKGRCGSAHVPVPLGPGGGDTAMIW